MMHTDMCVRVCVQVQWLLENFEKADGVSLPRCTMYGCYLRYCAHSSLDPVNTATFGKLVHSVFSNLTTRRLGTRYCLATTLTLTLTLP